MSKETSNLVPGNLLPNAPDPSVAAHAQLLRHTELQFTLPAFAQPKPPAWLEWLFHLLSRAAPVLGPIFKWGFWAVVAVLAAAVLYVLARQALRLRFPEWGRSAKAPPDPSDWRPTADEARHLLGDADKLAAGGNFDEAAHLLLLHSIQDIEDRRPHLVRPAYTSREIERLDGLPASARTAFATIARIVERSLFAGRPLDRNDFLACRQEYERFAFPESWSKAA